MYYATNRFGKAADTYAKFIDTPVATEDDILKYAFALFRNHDFEKSLAVAQKGLQKNARHAAFNRLVMYNNVDLKRYDEAEKAADAFFNASDNADYSCLDYRYSRCSVECSEEIWTRPLRNMVRHWIAMSQVDLWREIADAYELKNDYTQAIAAYKKYYDSLAQDKKTSENFIPVRASVLRRGYVLGHSLRSVCRPHGGIAGCRLCVRTCCRTSSPTVIWEICGAPAHTLPWTPKLQRDWRNLITEKVVDVLLAKNEPRYNSALIECYSYLGYYYLLKSDYPTSKEYLNKILAIDPTNATAKRRWTASNSNNFSCLSCREEWRVILSSLLFV